jgi:hypothetical protein
MDAPQGAARLYFVADENAEDLSAGFFVRERLRHDDIR